MPQGIELGPVMIRLLLSALIFVATPLSAIHASDAWPPKSVRIVVPFGPGSTPDSVARLLADRLQTKTGATFVVENKPGASGNTGTDAVAKADPDGATLGVSIVGPLVINALLFPKMPYDTATEIAPLTILATQPSVLVVSNSLGVSNVGELLTKLKQDGNKLNYGSIGYGSLSQLTMVTIAAKAGAAPAHIPYAGSPNAVTALVRGDVQMATLAAAAVAEQAKAGMLKMLAVASAKRSALLPDVPTLSESGFPGIEGETWIGLIAPAKTPPAMQQAIVAAVTSVIKDPSLREPLRALYMEPSGNTPAEFKAVLQQEYDRWAPVIKSNNIKIGQ